MAAAERLSTTTGEILTAVQQLSAEIIHHVAKHQGQIRRNVSQFDDLRAKP